MAKPDFYDLQELITEGVEKMAQEKHEDDSFSNYVYEMAMFTVYGEDYREWRNNVDWDD